MCASNSIVRVAGLVSISDEAHRRCGCGVGLSQLRVRSKHTGEPLPK